MLYGCGGGQSFGSDSLHVLGRRRFGGLVELQGDLQIGPACMKQDIISTPYTMEKDLHRMVVRMTIGM